jgi:hypothetical protein
MNFPRLPVWLALLCALAFPAFAASAEAAAKPAPDARFANVLYRTPDPAVWKMSDQNGRRTFSAPLPPPDFCTLTIFPGHPLQGSFADAFDQAIRENLAELKSSEIVRDGGVQSSKAMEGFDVLQRLIVAEGPGFHTAHWFLAGNSGGRFDLIAFQASSEEMYQHYGPAAVEFFTSVKLANSLGEAPALPAAAPAAAAKPRSTNAPQFGPVSVGDRVEIPWGGGWVPGVVRNVEGLMYFVHYLRDKDEETHDDFFAPNLVRPAGGEKTYAELFHGTMPDPEGGPIDLGATVEYYDGRWQPARVARRLGDRYVVFTDKAGYVTERWVTADQLRAPGSTTPYLAAPPPPPRRPTAAAAIRVGDLVEAHPRHGFWGPLTVVAQAGTAYFVKVGPDSGLSMRGWVDLSHMRPVGAKDPFQEEDLGFFVGHWGLTGVSFQNLIDRKVSGHTVTETYQNNSGAGQKAGDLVIRKDGTYELRNTVVYHDGKGRWERNPNQDEGGILLRGADGKGDQDCLVTNHQDGYAYLQGSIRGPGKWCTRLGAK